MSPLKTKREIQLFEVNLTHRELNIALEGLNPTCTPREKRLRENSSKIFSNFKRRVKNISQEKCETAYHWFLSSFSFLAFQGGVLDKRNPTGRLPEKTL